MEPTRLIFGVAAIGLGLVGFVVGDFALQWQPVPKGLPGREVLAYASAAVLVAAGFAAVWRRSSPWGALALAAMYGLWVVALHLPGAFADGDSVGAWNPVAELLAMSLGGFVGWALALRPALAEPGRRVFGLCAVNFGLAHFGYAEFTASMVPPVFPAPLFWAYLTGVGHAAGGLALVAGVLPRLAATLLAAMYGVFVLTLHLPRVVAAPGERIEWTMLFVALSLTGAAWIMRSADGAPAGRHPGKASAAGGRSPKGS